MSDKATTGDVVASWQAASLGADPNGHITNQWTHGQHEHVVSGLVEVGRVIEALRFHLQGWGFLGAPLLDYGCGTGRHAYWFAHAFPLVHACDASSGMLDVVRNCPLPNIACVHTDGTTIPLEAGSVGTVFSTICLQHQPRAGAVAILAEFHRVLASGGVAIFQLPVVSAAAKIRYVEDARTNASNNSAAWGVDEFRRAVERFEIIRLATDNHFGFHLLRKGETA